MYSKKAMISERQTRWRFRKQTATQVKIFSHLRRCSEDFKPPLDETVNILEYSKKIFEISTTFEAWLDKELIGLVAAYFNDYESRSGYITNVSVVREYKGLGIASMLLRMCIEYAKRNGFIKIELEVHKKNISAVHVYQKVGFVDCENRGDSTLMKLEVGGYD